MIIRPHVGLSADLYFLEGPMLLPDARLRDIRSAFGSGFSIHHQLHWRRSVLRQHRLIDKVDVFGQLIHDKRRPQDPESSRSVRLGSDGASAQRSRVQHYQKVTGQPERQSGWTA